AEAKQMAAKEAKYAESGEKAANDRAELGKELALVVLHVKGAEARAKVSVGGREISRLRWGQPVAVLPGMIAVVGTVGDERRFTRRFLTIAGGSTELEVDLAPKEVEPVSRSPVAAAPTRVDPTPAPKPHRASLLPYVAVTGGIGAAGIAMFAVAGAMNRA